ncbi:MAG: hypothetical protein ACM3SW_13530 [Actinomycetota bacterium]
MAMPGLARCQFLYFPGKQREAAHIFWLWRVTEFPGQQYGLALLVALYIANTSNKKFLRCLDSDRSNRCNFMFARFENLDHDISTVDVKNLVVRETHRAQELLRFAALLAGSSGVEQCAHQQQRCTAGSKARSTSK